MKNLVILTLLTCTSLEANELIEATILFDGANTSETVSLHADKGRTDTKRVLTGETCTKQVSLGVQCPQEFKCLEYKGFECVNFSFTTVCSEHFRSESYPCFEDKKIFVKTHDSYADVKINFNNRVSPGAVHETLSVAFNSVGNGLETIVVESKGNVALYERSRTQYTIAPDMKRYTVTGEIDIEAVDLMTLVHATSEAPKNLTFTKDGITFDLPKVSDPSTLGLSLSLTKNVTFGKDIVVLQHTKLKPGEYRMEEADGLTTRVHVPMSSIASQSPIKDLNQFQDATKKGKFELNVRVSLDLNMRYSEVNSSVPAYLVRGSLGNRPTHSEAVAKIKK